MSDQYVNVYRIEKNGIGPYASGFEDYMSKDMPTPYYDAGLPRSLVESELDKFHFGTPSKHSVKCWIRHSHKLAKAGFKVSLYKVKKNYVHSSEIQSMFIKRHAKKVLEWDVETFCRDI